MSGSSAGGGRFAPMFQHTWHFLLFALAGFINRQQQDIIEYYREESARTYCHDAAFGVAGPRATTHATPVGSGTVARTERIPVSHPRQQPGD